MKGKVLISRKRLIELENIELRYKTMEDSVKVNQERSHELVIRNLEYTKSIHRLSLELKDLRNQIESISNTKAKSRSINYFAAYAGQITNTVMTKLSELRFGFFETKIKKEDLREIESEIRRTIHNIFFI